MRIIIIIIIIIIHFYNFILKTESWMWKRRRLCTQGWTSAYAQREFFSPRPCGEVFRTLYLPFYLEA